MSKNGVLRWFAAGALLWPLVGMGASCATSDDDPSSTSNDDDGTGGSGGMPGTGGELPGPGGGGDGGAGGMGGSGANGGTGGVNLCGNTVIDPGEACEGTDFDGKTCETFGLGAGTLICNSFCQIVVAGCAPPENCNNGIDDDADGDTDCLDSECATLAQCIDSCAAPIPLSFPGFDYRSTAGRPDTTAASCGGATGSERIFTFTAPSTGTAYVSVSGSKDFNVAVTTACGDPLTEIGCAAYVHLPWHGENLQVPVTQGTTYYVVVDSAGPTQVGDFSIEIGTPFGSETTCNDWFDEDFDGWLDCDDASSCQATPTCAAGSWTYGSACLSNGQCAANANDPICLDNTFFNLPNGYCSEFCNLAANDCAGDGQCYDLGLSHNGVCLDGCSTSADCAPGTACVELGLPTKVCWIPPESGALCSNIGDDDSDLLTDCEDPSDCQLGPECTPGSGAVGDPCTLNNQCGSQTGSDPLCMTQNWFGYPNGYCSEFCNPSANDCPAGSVCGDFFGFPSGAGSCFKSCVSSTDCPPGLFCVNYGFGLHCNF